MINYLVESFLCLLVLHGFYHFFLRNTRQFAFNRFYLLFAVLFSVTAPLITVPVTTAIPTASKLREFTDATGGAIQILQPPKTGGNLQQLSYIPLAIYITISLILAFRFFSNLIRLFRLKRQGTPIDFKGCMLILVDKPISPFSFINNIFFHRSDFNTETAHKLMTHEMVHCRQFHSLDILVVELAKIVCWINPVLWLSKKAIQLNHEYLADNHVLQSYTLADYLHSLTSIVFRNNSLYLASNFNYSFTKKRIQMMTSNNVPRRAILKKSTAVALFFLLLIPVTFSQKDSLTFNLNFEKEWWFPILKKHQIEPSAFNNFDGVFEMGSSENRIDNGKAYLGNALIITQPVNGEYVMIRAKKAVHDLNKKTITCYDGVKEIYKISSTEVVPTESFSFAMLNYVITTPLTLENERKAAEEDQKMVVKEQQALEVEQKKLAEEQKAAVEDMKLVEAEQRVILEEKVKQKKVKQNTTLLQ